MIEPTPHPAADVVCPYCGAQAELVTGRRIYPHRSDLAHKHFYLCEPCHAYVGCHPGTCTPLGTPANADTRTRRALLHQHFDLLWRTGKLSRKEAYALLRRQMGMTQTQCHIGKFTPEQCATALAFVKKYLTQPRP